MIFTKPVLALRKTSSIFFTKLTLFKKIIAFCSKNRMKPTNRGWEKLRDVECISTKAVSVDTTMIYAGNRGIAPLFLILDASGGDLSDSRPGRFSLGKCPRCQLNGRPFRSHYWSGRLGRGISRLWQ
jgi:hypothetical protein